MEMDDEWGIHSRLDYTMLDPNGSNKALDAIKCVALGGNMIRKDGWLEPWSTKGDTLQERQQWLQDMANFISGIRCAKNLDRKQEGSRDWPYTHEALKTLQMEHMMEEQLAELKLHLYLCYTLLSLGRGHLPAKNRILPDGNFLHCLVCHGRDAKENSDIMQQLNKLPDED
ncbi:unnamed protein product [Peniophora sp. CBMAI 1063]|nr:unnamed protein product [Peniophora sp. CBMAI 1063]